MIRQDASPKRGAGEDHRLRLVLGADFIPSFFPILQKGFWLDAKVGCSVRSLFCDQLALTGEYLDRRIQTIFIDGKPVDDIDQAIVRDGSTLALSSAMPGLLGAAMRRGGFYAPMRSQIAHTERMDPQEVKEGQIVVKLFNLTIRELGPLFLERGIGVETEDLKDLFKRQSKDFWGACSHAAVDGVKTGPERLPDWQWTAERAHLVVEAP